MVFAPALRDPRIDPPDSLALSRPRLDEGDPAPWFAARYGDNPMYQMHALAGRYVIFCFIGNKTDPHLSMALSMLSDFGARFDSELLVSFAIATGGQSALIEAQFPNTRTFDDPQGRVTEIYGMGNGGWLLLDPTLRVLSRVDLHEAALIWEQIARLPPAQLHAGGPTPAPILMLPRIFEPELCRWLIDLYHTDGGTDSGFMRDVNGRTVGVIDHSYKRRRDHVIMDEHLKQAARERIERRLLPMVRRALGFAATRMERYIVACYDGAEGGMFRPHRDNTTKATAHRRFAVTINLNAEEFEGGDLRFPEFGQQTYRAPTGGAVVFSCALLHEATKVTRGTRYAFLPFLYDEEGAKLRAESSAFLGDAATNNDNPTADTRQAG